MKIRCFLLIAISGLAGCHAQKQTVADSKLNQKEAPPLFIGVMSNAEFFYFTNHKWPENFDELNSYCAKNDCIPMRKSSTEKVELKKLPDNQLQVCVSEDKANSHMKMETILSIPHFKPDPNACK